MSILKIIVSLLLPPGLWIVLMMVLAGFLYLRNRKWGLFMMGIALLVYASSTSLVSDLLIRSLESKYKPPISVDGDVIVVLMGGATFDTPGSGSLGNPSDESAQRLIAAAALQRKLGLPVIVSGGQVYPNSGYEGDTGQQTLIEIGVPERMITVERDSSDTTENAQNVKLLLQESGYRQPILVTSAFHSARSIKNFQKTGIQVIPYPTGYWVNGKFKWNGSLLFPSYEAVNKTGHALKEYLGIFALSLR